MTALLMLTLVINQAGSDRTRVTGSERPPKITVAVHDFAAVPPEWLRRARDEMTRIYREIGVDIVWQAPGPSSVTLPQPTLLILIRSGSEWTLKDLPPGVMAFASGTADERGRVAQLFYDRVEQFPFPLLYRATFLGHLMAHEVAHLLLPIHSHSPQGLMRALWDRADLERAREGRLRFTPEQARLIRSKVSQLAERAIEQ